MPYESSGCNIDQVIFFAVVAPLEIIHFDNYSKKGFVNAQTWAKCYKTFHVRNLKCS